MNWLHDLEQTFRVLGLAVSLVLFTVASLAFVMVFVEVIRTILGGLRYGP